MPGRNDDVWIAEPDFARRFFTFDRPANGTVAKRHIAPDNPSQERGNDSAAHDGFHSARV